MIEFPTLQPEPLALAYFGVVDPAIAGIHFRLPPRDPRIVAPERRRPGETGALRRVATAGYSIWIFRLDEEDVELIRRAWEGARIQAAV